MKTSLPQLIRLFTGGLCGFALLATAAPFPDPDPDPKDAIWIEGERPTKSDDVAASVVV